MTTRIWYIIFWTRGLPACFLDRLWNSLPELYTHAHSGMENMAARRSTRAKLRRLQRWFGTNKYDLSFLCPGLCGVQFDQQNGPSTIGIRFVTTLHSLPVGWLQEQGAHITAVSWFSCYHDAFRTWGHYHNNIVLFYHDSPITRSHFMDPTNRAIKGFYCTYCTFFRYKF